jgi:heavy metal sensor kinase
MRRLHASLWLLRSIRWRLTAWYVALLCGLLLVFSAGTYVAVNRLLLGNLDDLLDGQAKLVVETINLKDRQLRIQNDALRIGRSGDDHVTRLYRADGTLLFDSNPKIERADLEGDLRVALDGRQRYSLIPTAEGGLRLLSLPIRDGGQVVGALQVGLALEDINDTMRALLKVMLVLAPAMLLLATGGGLFLANRALAPIDKITRAAQQIGADNFSRRLDLRGPDDEIGRLARTFDAMISRLQAAFEQQRRFSADASHELRTPLTAMIGQIDVALDRPRDADSYRATLAAVREQAQRLARLASDLLLLARADAGPPAAMRERIDLAQLLPAVVAQVEPLAQARGQALRLDAPGQAQVCGDEDALIRLCLNLVDNAIRYTPAGGQIDITCSRRDRQIVLSIADNGPGIAPEHLPQLFERFFRADRGRSSAQGGSGLGLAIAQSIVLAHGGRLEVSSALGQGSVFSAILPAAPE